MACQQSSTSYAPHSVVYVVNKDENAAADNVSQQRITVEGVFPYYDDQIHNCESDVISFCLDVEPGRQSKPGL